MGSGSAAESARRPAARERQGQRRRMYRVGSGAAAWRNRDHDPGARHRRRVGRGRASGCLRVAGMRQ